MSIEAIGRAVSVAPTIGRGVSFSGIPAPKMEGFSVGRINNPFLGIPKAASYIENKGPSLLGPKVGIIKNPRVESKIGKFREFGGFSGARRAEAERIVAVAKKPAILERRAPVPAVVRFPEPQRGLDLRVIRNPVPVPKVEAVPQSMVQGRRITFTPVQSQPQVEQVVERKKVVKEDKKEDKPQVKRSEKQSVAKIRIVEAVRITQLRRLAIFEAAKKVKEEAERKGEEVTITGKKLKKFLSAEFWKYISPLSGREGRDGTIPLTLNALENNQTEYTNLEKAQSELSKPVAEHIPLKSGEDGRVATIEEVREVLEGKEKETTKSQALSEIVIKRVVRKNVNTVVEEKEEIVGETTLKSLGLEDLFPKAA